MDRQDRIEIEYNKGIRVREGDAQIVLDPSRRTESSVVSHAHMDHLVKGSLMTHQTRDIMEIRLDSRDGAGVEYGEELHYGGFDIQLTGAGHCLGSAMVHITGDDTDLLYTGDVNPDGGLTVGPARPRSCRTLIIEATYGKHVLPNKDQVTNDLVAWCRSEIERSHVILGAYEFGKAQEVVAALSGLDRPIYSTDKVRRICEVYTKHGVPLRCETLEEEPPTENSFIVLPSGKLRRPKNSWARRMRREGAMIAYVSGWCGIYDFTRRRGYDAQFPMSDHGDLDALLSFVERCSPEEVYTVYGSPEALAERIMDTLGIPARSLKKGR